MCISKRELGIYKDVDWQQFVNTMMQCDLISGDMLLIGIFDNPDKALDFLLHGRISIRDHSCIRSQDNSIIKL